MARNEEKQQGKLNRLWLQKERDEGRLKDVHERRPKLGSLTTASSVKKWIPSIKKEIEYYLQQSQLSHYPERKIAEFELCISALESEYKRFIAKLRVLDPSCKHTPWTPRAYCKRRADADESASTVKSPRSSSSQDDRHQWRGDGKPSMAAEHVGCLTNAAQAASSIKPTSDTTETVSGVQDQPLSFDRTRLAVLYAAAAFRGPSFQPAAPQSQTLAKLLQAGLPNLSTPSSRLARTSQSEDTEDGHKETEEWQKAVPLQKSDSKAAGLISGKSSSTDTGKATTHILGLDCYSSSDGECDI